MMSVTATSCSELLAPAADAHVRGGVPRRWRRHVTVPALPSHRAVSQPRRTDDAASALAAAAV
jgi:hypothetical protein